MPRTDQAQHAYERSPGAAAAPLPGGYRPRRPETTAFYRVIADHLETYELMPRRPRTSVGVVARVPL